MFVGAALAGGVGAGLRYIVDALVTTTVFASPRRPGRFPVGILVVNTTGSFALGVLTGLGADVFAGDLGWMLGVGLLGGYTTFSTVSLDSVMLAREGRTGRGWANALGTLGSCVVAAAAGLAIDGFF